jgi:hypothetical protein
MGERAGRQSKAEAPKGRQPALPFRLHQGIARFMA